MEKWVFQKTDTIIPVFQYPIIPASLGQDSDFKILPTYHFLVILDMDVITST